MIVSRGFHRLVARVRVLRRDKPNGWFSLEDSDRGTEIVWPPHVVLKEILDEGGVRLRPLGFAETSIPISPDPSADGMSCEGEARIAEVRPDEFSNIDRGSIIIYGARPPLFGLREERVESLAEQHRIRLVRRNVDIDDRSLHERMVH